MSEKWARQILECAAVLLEQQPDNKALADLLHIFDEVRVPGDSFPWIELLRRVTADERAHRALAASAWEDHDVTTAVRHRGIADGLVMARDHHADVIAESKRATDD